MHPIQLHTLRIQTKPFFFFITPHQYLSQHPHFMQLQTMLCSTQLHFFFRSLHNG
jgi:hypothetical protein